MAGVPCYQIACRWLLVFVCILFIFAIAPLVQVVVDLLNRHPPPPPPPPPEFAVSSATVSSWNLSSSSPHQLFSDFNLTLSVQNPKKGDQTYFELEAATLFYGSDTISETSFDRNRNDTTMRVKVVTVDELGGGGDTEKGSDDLAVVTTFHLKVVAVVRYSTGSLETNERMRVECPDVAIGFMNSTSAVGTLVGPPKLCKV